MFISYCPVERTLPDAIGYAWHLRLLYNAALAMEPHIVQGVLLLNALDVERWNGK